MDASQTSIIQVTNIAPQATRDQMQTLFSFVGKIDDIRLYPMIRDATVSVSSRCCFVKFNDPHSVSVAQHLTNTVFIDRAIIVTPLHNGDVPDERDGLIMATQFQQQGTGNGLSRLTGFNGMNGISATPVVTPDANLEAMGLPAYPVLPAGTPLAKVDEIRRTVSVVGIDSTVTAQACMELFAEAGEIKYFRFCTRPNDPVKYALIEFSDVTSIGPALQLNDRTLGMSNIKVTHSVQAITKPQPKSSEAVQREIEEAMSKVKETQSLVSAAVDPLIGMLGGMLPSGRSSLTRSRSRSKSRRRSRSRDRSHRRSRSRDRKRRSRSRDRRRSRSRERRRRSRSRERKRAKKSRSKSREKRKRSSSRDRKKDKEEKKDEKNQENKEETVEENGSEKPEQREVEKPAAAAEVVATEETKKKSRSRSTSKSRKRSRSRERKKKSRSRSREKRRSRSRDRKSRRSSSRERRRKRSRSRKRKDRSKSKDRSSKSTSSKVHRDYDVEEAGFENPKEPIPPPPPEDVSSKKESLESEDMEISNSP